MEKVIFQSYPHFYDRMEQFIKENEKIKSCDICFLGDSLIEMMDVKNFNNLNCVNRGIISDKSAGVLMTLSDRVFPINPKMVFLLIGSNDICDGYTLAQIKSNIIDIINMIKEYNNAKIIISTVLPPCYHEAPHVDRIYPNCRDILRIKGLNDIIKMLDGVEVFDSYAILADEYDSLKVEDTLDGVHITKNAYDKLKKELIKIL